MRCAISVGLYSNPTKVTDGLSKTILLCEAIRLRGRDGRVVIDGVEALTYLLPHDQPIHSFSLEVDGDKRTVGQASFDEVCVEPLLRE